MFAVCFTPDTPGRYPVAYSNIKSKEDAEAKRQEARKASKYKYSLCVVEYRESQLQGGEIVIQ